MELGRGIWGCRDVVECSSWLGSLEYAFIGSRAEMPEMCKSAREVRLRGKLLVPQVDGNYTMYGLGHLFL